MSNKVDFDYEVSKQLQRNIKDVREELKCDSMQFKINNYAKKYNLEPNYVEQLIVDDINFAINFAKDPGRQSIHEKVAGRHLANSNVVKEHGSFKKLPSGGRNAKYVTNNGVSSENLDGVKSIDFEIKVNDNIIYATCKYTKDEGGAQDNQYADVEKYLKTALTLISRGNAKSNEYFIAILDGEYYQRYDRIQKLEQITLNQIPVLSVNDVEEYLINRFLGCDEKEESDTKS